MNLYTGETLWKINTTNALRCGMQFLCSTQLTTTVFVVHGIWTTGTLPACDTGGNLHGWSRSIISIHEHTGTQWNLYDGVTGQYVMSVVNGSSSEHSDKMIMET